MKKSIESKYGKQYNGVYWAIDVVHKLLKSLFRDRRMPALSYVRVTEKFDVVKRSKNRDWILTPGRE